MNKLDRPKIAPASSTFSAKASRSAPITRLTGASKNTVTKLLIDAGKACAAYHDDHVRNVTGQAHSGR